MSRYAIIAVMSFFTTVSLTAQFDQERKSIHWRESEEHAVVEPAPTLQKTDAPVPMRLQRAPRALARKIFGWQPYWTSAAAMQQYDYSALSHIAYFSFDVDTATGSYVKPNGLHDWGTTPLIDYAHQRGVKVMLTVVNFGNAGNVKILSDTNKQNRLMTDIIQMLLWRNGDGVNLDFEAVPASQKTNLVSFVRKLAKQLKASLPEGELSMATPAVDWSNAWDFAALAQACDYLIVMGYDFYGSWSSTAGPEAPLAGESYNVSRSVSTYLAAGVPPQKLLLGVPWYGYDWYVQDSLRKSAVVSGMTGSSRTYTVAEPAALAAGKKFDATTKSTWYSYKSGTQWRQCWYDDSLSLALKNDLVRTNNLGGVGIWALGYEGGRPELWNSYKAMFPLASVADREKLPAQFVLEQNYPNPFNPSTRIRFALSHSSHIRLSIYNVLGQLVATAADETREAGSHDIDFDASKLSSGVYFYALDAGSFHAVKKMAVLR